MSNPTSGHGYVLPQPYHNYFSDFEKLYDSYAPVLLGIIQNLIPDKQQANDLLQLAFQEIWRKKEAYQPDKIRLFTWLYQITYATVLAQLSETGAQAANVPLYVTQSRPIGSRPALHFLHHLI